MEGMSVEEAVEAVEAMDDAEGVVEPQGEEAPEETVPDVVAPQWWDAADKAAFAKLSPEQQAVVAKNEAKREAVLQKEKAAHAEGRKTAVEAAHRAAALAGQLGGVLPDHVAAFNDKYDVDWDEYPRWAAENPHDAAAFEAEYAHERAALEHVIAAQAEAERVAHETFHRERMASLHETAPELASPAALQALSDYAGQQDIGSEDLRFAQASHLKILNKARLYDEIMGKAAASPVRKASGQTPARVPPQGQARPQGSSHEREAQALRNRFAQKRDIDSAASLITKLGY